MLCLLENSALQRVAHLCIHVSGDGYLWLGFNSAELLSTTCRTMNISVAMVDSSPPKFCLHFWAILYIIENNALQKVAYMCIQVSMDDMTEQGSTMLSCWVAHIELRTWLGWTVLSCVSLLQPHLTIVLYYDLRVYQHWRVLSPYSLTNFSASLCGYKM